MSNPVIEFANEDVPQAVELAAKENFERDVLIGITKADEWPEQKEVYLKEAEFLFEAFGENWEPQFPHHHVIRVKS